MQLKLDDKDKVAFNALSGEYRKFQQINKEYLKTNKEVSPMIMFLLKSRVL